MPESSMFEQPSSEPADLEKRLSEYWQPSKPREFKRPFFDLQYRFAKLISERTGQPLLEAITNYTGQLRFGIANYKGYTFESFKDGLTDDNIVDFGYEEFVKEHFRSEVPVEYHPEGSTRYGCFYYDQDANSEDTLKIHFYNCEGGDSGPLDKSKTAFRRQEFKDVLTDIRAMHPEAQRLSGRSWLYNLPAYRRIFPDFYTSDLQPVHDRGLWKWGTTVWGQFMDNKLDLKPDLAEILLQRVEALGPDESLDSVLDEPPLMRPLSAEAPLEELYRFYGIE